MMETVVNMVTYNVFNVVTVDDLCDIDFSPLNKMVEENTHYNVKWNKLFFYGLCKDCQ